MRPSFSLPSITAAALAAALALGCGDNDGVTSPATQTRPSFGAEVIRFEAPWENHFADASAGLTLLAGATLDELPDLCAGGGFTKVADWLLVVHPSKGGETVLHARIKNDELSVVVWGTATDDICGDLQGVAPLAVGTVHEMFTDNDFAGTGSHADSFGDRIEGTVANPATGQRYHLKVGIPGRLVVLPDGTVKVPVGAFIRLTPIGG
jgi:hypothetical protein